MNKIKPIFQYILIVGYVLVLTAIAWYFHKQSLIGIDDANIYMVYMKHLAEGHGFVYNVGGERVEGFTSLLWTLIGALFFRLTAFPEIYLMGLNVLLVSYGLYAIAQFIRAHAPHSTQYLLLFFGLIATSLGYIEWTVYSLMETGLWSVLLILTSLQIMQFPKDGKLTSRTLRLAVYLLLLLLTRPESMVWVPAFIILNGVRGYLNGIPFRKITLNTLVLAIVAGAGFAALIAWRLYYFGYPLPNTYYAKVSADWQQNLLDGLKYDISFLIHYPVVLLGILFALFHWSKKIWNPRGRTTPNVITLSIALILLGITLFNPLVGGGDYFPYFRFIQPTIPILVLPPILALIEQQADITPKRRLDLLILCTCSLSIGIHYFWFGTGKEISKKGIVMTPDMQWLAAIRGRSNAAILNDFFEPLAQKPSQGIMAAGANALVYAGSSIDLLGLNNTKMAHADKIKDKNTPKNHQSFNKQIFYELHPDIIFFMPLKYEKTDLYAILKNRFFLELCKNIVFDPEFKEKYALCFIERKTYKPYLNTLARRAFLESLDTSVYKVTLLPYE